MKGTDVTVTTDQAQWFAQAFTQMVANVDQAVLGKQHVIRLALTCMLSEGHLLLEDVPGTGKTQLARAIAGTVQGSEQPRSSSRRTCCPATSPA